MCNLTQLVTNDTERMRILAIVRSLSLPDCYVAAGFLRNKVWDHLHATATALNDIDVVFYDPADQNNTTAKNAQTWLNSRYPEFIWQVKNQALMHQRNNDPPYLSTLDAMHYWPEKETAIGASLDSEGKLTIINAFGLESLMLGHITHNKARSIDIFMQRVNTKGWLKTWPNLQLRM